MSSLQPFCLSIASWAVGTRSWSWSVSTIIRRRWSSSVAVVIIFVSVIPTIISSVVIGISTPATAAAATTAASTSTATMSWSAHVNAWCRRVCSFGDRIIYTNSSAIQLHSICPFHSLLWVINSLKINKSKSSWSSSSLIINHIDPTQWSISRKNFPKISLCGV